MGKPKYEIGTVVKYDGWLGKIKDRTYDASALPNVYWKYKIGNSWVEEKLLQQADWRDIKDLTKKENIN